MAARNQLANPSTLDELLLFRLTRLLATAGAPVVRWCEGQHGITRREWRIIVALAQSGPLLSSALAERVHLERGRTSTAVSGLVKKGLAERTPRAGDRRKVDIGLTSAAQAIYGALFPRVAGLNRTLLATLSDAECELLDTLLARLQTQADAYWSGSSTWPKARRQGRHAPVG